MQNNALFKVVPNFGLNQPGHGPRKGTMNEKQNDEQSQEAQAAGSELKATVRPSKFEIEALGINLADNLNTKFWMDYFTKWEEADFVEATMEVECHPKGWDYACLCCECQSNA